MKVLLFVLIFPIVCYAGESVYCLHGFLRSCNSMKKISTAFEQKGYNVVNWGYPSREKTIEEHAEDLVENLVKTAAVNPNEPIHFVTHSLGGIITRAALNHPKCPEEAKMGRAVLIAPPNQGSKFGNFLNYFGPIRKIVGPKAGAQVLLIEDFSYIGEFPATCEVLIISGTFGWNPISRGKNDGKVGVTESCLNTPHEHKTHFSGHSWIMYSDCVIRCAGDFIDRAG